MSAAAAWLAALRHFTCASPLLSVCCVPCCAGRPHAYPSAGHQRRSSGQPGGRSSSRGGICAAARLCGLLAALQTGQQWRRGQQKRECQQEQLLPACIPAAPAAQFTGSLDGCCMSCCALLSHPPSAVQAALLAMSTGKEFTIQVQPVASSYSIDVSGYAEAAASKGDSCASGAQLTQPPVLTLMLRPAGVEPLRQDQPQPGECLPSTGSSHCCMAGRPSRCCPGLAMRTSRAAPGGSSVATQPCPNHSSLLLPPSPFPAQASLHGYAAAAAGT